MSQHTMWWLMNTSAGRRTLGRMLPASAIPIATRRQMCAEQGHEWDRPQPRLHRGNPIEAVPHRPRTCTRCGERER
jgi:hypothetical protein